MKRVRIGALAAVMAMPLQAGSAWAIEGNNLASVEVPAGTGIYHTHVFGPAVAAAAASRPVSARGDGPEVAESPALGQAKPASAPRR